MKKRLWSLLFALCMIFGLLPGAALAAPDDEPVEISEATFPDPNFRDYVSRKIDTREPFGILTPEEYMTVTSIDVNQAANRSRMGPPIPYIHDLTGIEYFRNLASLNLCENPVSGLDLSRLSRLRELLCDHCSLTELDLSACPELVCLHCDSNLLHTLNLTGCTELEELFCDHNQLTALDISDCPKLIKCICRMNRLAALDISCNPELDWLFCSFNQLTGLNLSGCPNLTSLECGNNLLEALDLSHNPKLDRLQCQTNLFRELDVSSCPALTFLACGDSILETLNTTGCGSLTWLYCGNNALTSMDLRTNSGLSVLDCAHNRLEHLDLSSCGVWHLDCSGNRLAALDLSAGSAPDYFSCEKNICPVRETNGEYLLSDLPDLDVSRTSLVTGGSFVDGKIVFDEYFDEITYAYDTGCPGVEDPTFTLSRGHVHSMEYHPQVDCTCTEDGIREHWHCSGCGKDFADPDGENELPDLTIPAAGHDFRGPWISDETGHWQTCRCGAVSPTQPHTYGDWTVTQEPTTETEGLRTRTCTVCGYAQTEAVPVLPPIPDALPFTDVAQSVYFYHSVAWAVSRGITGGTSPTTFSPGRTCTRAEAVTFLWSMAGRPAPGSAANPFADVPDGAYYQPAVLWAVENGITSGIGSGRFGPELRCTRAQIVTFLWNLEGRPVPETVRNPFADVPDGVYFARPVLWAAEAGITAGTGPSRFGPELPCTRAQIVTFLWRDAGSPV